MPRLVILGAGYGGLAVAQKIDELMRGSNDWDVTLVDRRDYHLIQIRVHEVAANSLAPERVQYPLSDLLIGTRTRFVQADIQKIDPYAREVHTSTEVLPYDSLVIAIGSETAYYGVPGLKENSFAMKSLDDAVAYRKSVLRAFRTVMADPAGAEQPDPRTTFVIGGGGLTGVELAAEMVNFCQDVESRYPRARALWRVVLLEGQSRILPQLSEEESQYALDKLTQLGVEVHTNAMIERLEPGVVHLKGHKKVRAGVVAWAGGLRAPDMLKEAGFETAQGGRIPVDPYLRTSQFPNVYVIGDSAIINDGRTGKFVGWTAQYAERQGHYVARVLLDAERGISPVPYEPFSLGTAISFGRNEALTITGPLRLTGWAGRLAKNASYEKYELGIRMRAPQPTPVGTRRAS